MRAEERLAPWVVGDVRDAIADAGGTEVFFVGSVSPEGLVESVTVGARGTEDAVPVLRPHLRGGDVVIHNHPPDGGRSNLTPSSADLAIASRLGEEGIGFFIVDNEVTEVYAAAEPVAAAEVAPIDTPALAAALGPGGALARIADWFEERQSQVRMLREVCGAFNGDGLLAAEAGTGVGKSLAYLIPALAWAKQNGERVVVSTNTINLQQQLVEKDIPLVKRILGEPDLKVALVKGRGNYLCLRRLTEALEEATLFEDPDPDLEAIREWSRTTSTGDRSDLSFYPSEELWSRVCSEADSCLGLRCSRREGCFVLRARRAAASAQVLVANHHLLFADLAVRASGHGFDDPAVLPPFRRIVFDEAHNLEKAATSFFSESFSRLSVGRYLNRLHRRRKGRVGGLLSLLARVAGKPQKGIAASVAEVDQAAADLDERCRALMGEAGNLLLDAEGKPRFLAAASAPLVALSTAIRSLTNGVSEWMEKIEGTRVEDLAWECRVQLDRLAMIADLADRFRAADGTADRIFWMEEIRLPARGRAAREPQARPPGAARLVITPLDVGPLMKGAVYQPMRTAVFTSATLTVAESFAYWAGRIGLDARAERDVETAAFPSPFDYRNQVLLGVPTDAPLPDAPGYREFLGSFLTSALSASGGAGLVLFTSKALLADVHAVVAPALAERGIRVLRQGDDDRARLLSRFREETSSVLFATDSFWEGVDAPGETLQVVVLCRLPFRVPSEPVLKARMTAIEARGGDPFMELSLPDAVVRLRQGFGRLMRRRDDRGVVLILDSRVVRKRYGELFLESLPPTGRIIAPSAEVLAGVASFFGQQNFGQ